MIDIELIVSELDKKIAFLESIKSFKKREPKSVINYVSVDDFTDIYELENRTVKSIKKDIKIEDPDDPNAKRRRIRNPRYNEEEYLLKNSSREFTNAIRGKVGKVADEIDSIKSESSSSEVTVVKPKYEYKPKKQPTSRRFFCKLCNKAFSKGYSLTRHMFLHTGYRPHVCHICDYKFIQRSDLERHLTVHQDVPQFACDVCPLKFKTKKSLRNHAILHDDATPFKCPMKNCGKKFRSNKTLRIHHMVSHSDITYECDYCGRLYTLKDYLKTHMKSHLNAKQKERDLAMRRGKSFIRRQTK